MLVFVLVFGCLAIGYWFGANGERHSFCKVCKQPNGTHLCPIQDGKQVEGFIFDRRQIYQEMYGNMAGELVPGSDKLN